MIYALSLYFDKNSEKEFITLMEKLKAEKSRSRFLDLGIHPHITLTCLRDPDIEKLHSSIAQYCARQRAFPVKFNSVAVNVDLKYAFIAPTMTEELLKVHRELHELTAEFDKSGFENDAPGNWEAHNTLDLDDELDVICEVADLFAKNFKPLIAYIDRIALIKLEKPVYTNAFVYNFQQ